MMFLSYDLGQKIGSLERFSVVHAKIAGFYYSNIVFCVVCTSHLCFCDNAYNLHLLGHMRLKLLFCCGYESDARVPLLRRVFLQWTQGSADAPSIVDTDCADIHKSLELWQHSCIVVIPKYQLSNNYIQWWLNCQWTMWSPLMLDLTFLSIHKLSSCFSNDNIWALILKEITILHGFWWKKNDFIQVNHQRWFFSIKVVIWKL